MFQYGIGFLLPEYGRRRGAHIQFIELSIVTWASGNAHIYIYNKCVEEIIFK